MVGPTLRRKGAKVFKGLSLPVFLTYNYRELIMN